VRAAVRKAAQRLRKTDFTPSKLSSVFAAVVTFVPPKVPKQAAGIRPNQIQVRRVCRALDLNKRCRSLIHPDWFCHSGASRNLSNVDGIPACAGMRNWVGKSRIILVRRRMTFASACVWLHRLPGEAVTFDEHFIDLVNAFPAVARRMAGPERQRGLWPWRG
jgi:hypothetical protein